MQTNGDAEGQGRHQTSPLLFGGELSSPLSPINEAARTAASAQYTDLRSLSRRCNTDLEHSGAVHFDPENGTCRYAHGSANVECGQASTVQFRLAVSLVVVAPRALADVVVALFLLKRQHINGLGLEAYNWPEGTDGSACLG